MPIIFDGKTISGAKKYEGTTDMVENPTSQELVSKMPSNIEINFPEDDSYNISVSLLWYIRARVSFYFKATEYTIKFKLSIGQYRYSKSDITKEISLAGISNSSSDAPSNYYEIEGFYQLTHTCSKYMLSSYTDNFGLCLDFTSGNNHIYRIYPSCYMVGPF